MDLVRVKDGLKNKKIEINFLTNYPPPPYPEHLFKLHTLGVFAGSRNSGKTNACSLLIKEYFKQGSFTHLFLISPTFESNPALHTLPIERENIYTDFANTNGHLQDIEDKVGEYVANYRNNERYIQAYNNFINSKLTMEDQIILEMKDFEKPVKQKIPSCCVIIDDMSFTDIYTPSKSNKFINLVLRHRHLHRVGISIFMLVQNFKQGVPKVLRQNTQQFFLYKINDTEVLKKIYEEFANVCSKEQFLEMYKLATTNDHDFFTIDPFNEDKEKRFRKNFDIYLKLHDNNCSIVDDEIEKIKSKKRKRDNTNDNEVKKNH